MSLGLPSDLFFGALCDVTKGDVDASLELVATPTEPGGVPVPLRPPTHLRPPGTRSNREGSSKAFILAGGYKQRANYADFLFG